MVLILLSLPVLHTKNLSISLSNNHVTQPSLLISDRSSQKCYNFVESSAKVHHLGVAKMDPGLDFASLLGIAEHVSKVRTWDWLKSDHDFFYKNKCD